MPTCNAGFGSCDGNARNGCETATTTVTNCGACGVQCTNTNGTTTCTGGACVPTCSAGFKTCDGNPNNGCETNTNSDVNNCNTCGNVCPAAGGTPNCVGGVCGVSTCNPGLGDCDGDYPTVIQDLVQHASHGLRRLFLCCEGFTESTDVTAWMLEKKRPSPVCTMSGVTLRVPNSGSGNSTRWSTKTRTIGTP